MPVTLITYEITSNQAVVYDIDEWNFASLTSDLTITATFIDQSTMVPVDYFTLNADFKSITINTTAETLDGRTRSYAINAWISVGGTPVEK